MTVHTCYFAGLPESLNLASAFAATGSEDAQQKLVNPWTTISKMLEHTGDHFIWIVTTDQLDKFLGLTKKYNLDKYMVVQHRKAGEGTTNRNYMDRPRRLKVFIMKGTK